MHTIEQVIEASRKRNALHDIECEKRMRYHVSLRDSLHHLSNTQWNTPAYKHVLKLFFASTQAFSAYLNEGRAENERWFAEQDALIQASRLG